MSLPWVMRKVMSLYNLKDIAIASTFLSNTKNTIFHSYQKLAIAIENEKIIKHRQNELLLELGRNNLNEKSF